MPTHAVELGQQLPFILVLKHRSQENSRRRSDQRVGARRTNSVERESSIFMMTGHYEPERISKRALGVIHGLPVRKAGVETRHCFPESFALGYDRCAPACDTVRIDSDACRNVDKNRLGWSASQEHKGCSQSECTSCQHAPNMWPCTGVEVPIFEVLTIRLRLHCV